MYSESLDFLNVMLSYETEKPDEKDVKYLKDFAGYLDSLKQREDKEKNQIENILEDLLTDYFISNG